MYSINNIDHTDYVVELHKVAIEFADSTCDYYMSNEDRQEMTRRMCRLSSKCIDVIEQYTNKELSTDCAKNKIADFAFVYSNTNAKLIDISDRCAKEILKFFSMYIKNIEECALYCIDRFSYYVDPKYGLAIHKDGKVVAF